MLRELMIENLAVIAEASIVFESGMSAFTGETGAGKSILIHGINAVLGQRVTKDLVRSGCASAKITARFTKLSPEVREKLTQLGMSAEDDELLLSREIFADGGSSARVNGKLSAVASLRELGELLITIHGQHDSQILLQPERHLSILDGFGGDSSYLKSYQSSFHALQTCARRYSTLYRQEQANSKRREELRECTEEIGALQLQSGEEAELDAELAAIQNVDSIVEALHSAVFSLRGEAHGVLTNLELAERAAETAAELLPDMAGLTERIRGAKLELDDIAEELEQRLDGLDARPERLAYLTERRRELDRLLRVYHCADGEELLALYHAALEELEGLNQEESLDSLAEEKARLLQETTARAKALSAYRAETAERFIQQVSEELRGLDMPDVRISVQFTTGRLTQNGMETAEFLISANRGEPPKPIAKIASGGELSRVMLALRSVTALQEGTQTLIFDEIDTGVSGRAAQKIGAKLQSLSAFGQVLCVTHLSQIAVSAAHQYLIEKHAAERTVTSVTKLDQEGRIREIARIMGGENPSELMLKTAEAELLRASEQFL